MNRKPDDGLRAPGLKLDRGRNRVAYYWVARNCARYIKGFTPKTVRLHQETPEERAAYCRKMHGELMLWLGRKPDRVEHIFDGTLSSLVKIYQEHPQSRYHRVQANTRGTYDDVLRLIDRIIGMRRVEGINGVDFLTWYDRARLPKKSYGMPRIRRAHGLMTMLRIILAWGAVLELPHCQRLSGILSKLEFESSAPRRQFMTLAQVKAIIAKAHELGRPSIALAQALQFDLTLRQIDVIGRWEKITTDHARTGIVDGLLQWKGGLTWTDLANDLVLEKQTSKTKTLAAFDLKLYSLVMAEIERVPADKRVGPLIVDEHSGLPYKDKWFGREWRRIATAAGIPNDVWNRDSRAGGISEVTDTSDLESARHHAQHSDSHITQRYSRNTLSKTRTAAVLRMKKREEG